MRLLTRTSHGNLTVVMCEHCSNIYAAGTVRGLRVILRHPIWCRMRIAKDRLAWEFLTWKGRKT